MPEFTTYRCVGGPFHDTTMDAWFAKPEAIEGHTFIRVHGDKELGRYIGHLNTTDLEWVGPELTPDQARTITGITVETPPVLAHATVNIEDIKEGWGSYGRTDIS